MRNIDKEEDINNAIEEKSFDYRNEKNIPNKEKILQMEKLENENFSDDDKTKNIYNENNQIEFNGEDIEEGEEGENEWFYCDECLKVIKENKIKYECEECQDYNLCKECYNTKNHMHQMKKSKVPLGCKVFFKLF